MRKQYSRLYASAERQEDLQWSRESIFEPVIRVVESEPHGKALEFGCGAAATSIYLASQGWECTGVDFVSKAIRMAESERIRAKVELRLFESDILEIELSETFDMILDFGCLHSISGPDLFRYRKKLHGWLKPSGNYFLIHFGKRHLFDYSPFGPIRRSKHSVLEIIGQEFELVEFHEERTDNSLLTGPKAIRNGYWFRKISPFPELIIKI